MSGLLDPGIRTLAALGALDKALVVEDGQWWRLFSAPLLHGGLIHIAFNGIALFFAGVVLENVIGRAWFAGVFAVSAVTGSAMSLLINPETLISVGASGAIMGLFAAAFAVAYRYPVASPMRTYLISGSLRVSSRPCSRCSAGLPAKRSTMPPIWVAPLAARPSAAYWCLCGAPAKFCRL